MYTCILDVLKYRESPAGDVHPCDAHLPQFGTKKSGREVIPHIMHLVFTQFSLHIYGILNQFLLLLMAPLQPYPLNL